jgi:hypothetical protein
MNIREQDNSLENSIITCANSHCHHLIRHHYFRPNLVGLVSVTIMLLDKFLLHQNEYLHTSFYVVICTMLYHQTSAEAIPDDVLPDDAIPEFKIRAHRGYPR